MVEYEKGGFSKINEKLLVFIDFWGSEVSRGNKFPENVGEVDNKSLWKVVFAKNQQSWAKGWSQGGPKGAQDGPKRAQGELKWGLWGYFKVKIDRHLATIDPK